MKREKCDKPMKVSKTTLDRLKKLRKVETEPLGDVVKRLLDEE